MSNIPYNPEICHLLWQTKCVCVSFHEHTILALCAFHICLFALLWNLSVPEKDCSYSLGLKMKTCDRHECGCELLRLWILCYHGINWPKLTESIIMYYIIPSILCKPSDMVYKNPFCNKNFLICYCMLTARNITLRKNWLHS